jgi:hypothetical protein
MGDEVVALYEEKKYRGITLTAVDTRYSILVYGGLSEDTTGI